MLVPLWLLEVGHPGDVTLVSESRAHADLLEANQVAISADMFPLSLQLGCDLPTARLPWHTQNFADAWVAFPGSPVTTSS